MIDAQKLQERLDAAIGWIRDQEDDDFWFAMVLRIDLGIDYLELDEYLKNYGVEDVIDRKRIMHAVMDAENGRK